MRTVVTLTGLVGLLSLLSIVACGRVDAPVVMEGTDDLSARLSEYVFLHKTRDESAPVQVMAGLNTCPQ